MLANVGKGKAAADGAELVCPGAEGPVPSSAQQPCAGAGGDPGG